MVADLATEVANGRPVYHVGFQLGCRIGYSASIDHPDAFSGLIIIDPEIPDWKPHQIEESQANIQQLSESIQSTKIGLYQHTFGLGWMVASSRNYFNGHQENHRSSSSKMQSIDERQDRRLWEAALREQQLLHKELAEYRQLQTTSLPILKIHPAALTTDVEEVAGGDELIKSTATISQVSVEASLPTTLTALVSSSAIIKSISDFAENHKSG